MFWQFNLDSSGLETLLAKEDVTLLEVLDEEDVLQECKTPNAKLLDFLTKDEIFREFLHVIVDNPKDDVEESLKYKYMNIACEIIVLDIDAILEKIACEQDYLDIIWSFTDNLPPLNPLIASFFSKVITILVCRKCQQTFEYLKSHDAVNKLIVHIEISAIMDLFVKMVSVVDHPGVKMEICKWLVEEKLISKLIEYLHPKENEEKQYFAAVLLKELILIGRESMLQYQNQHERYEIIENPLILALQSKETVEKLLSVMFDHIDEYKSLDSLVNGIVPILALIEVKRPNIDGLNVLIEAADMQKVLQGCEAALEVLATRLGDFHNALVLPPNMDPMETTFGTLNPPLGKLRLAIAGLIASSISANSPIINESLSKTGTINLLLDLFSQYEWNNFLHTHVEHCVYGILNSESQLSNDEENSIDQTNTDILITHLFQDCNIVQRCLMWWEMNEISEKSGKPRKGYMGHLTKMINEIRLAREKGTNSECLKSIFNEFSDEIQEEWNDLIVGSLEDINKKNVCAPLNSLFNHIDSDSEGEDCRLLNLSQYDGTFQQQAFENYQVQPMSNDFIETFGYEECSIEDNENVKNPLEDVGNVDFAINANEESEEEKLFNNICEQKIHPFDESSDSEEEDMWEEKEINCTITPNQKSRDRIPGESSSDEEEDMNKFSSTSGTSDLFEDVFVHNLSDRNERMDVDNEWAATFDSFSSNTKEMASPWPVADSSVTMSTNGAAFANFEDSATNPLSTNGEDFANFTDLAKFDIACDNSNASAVAMDTECMEKTDTECMEKTGISSPYEVKMEEDSPVVEGKSLGSPKKDNFAQSEDDNGKTIIDMDKNTSISTTTATKTTTSSCISTPASLPPSASQASEEKNEITVPVRSQSDDLHETSNNESASENTESLVENIEELVIESNDKTIKSEMIHENRKMPIAIDEKCEETDEGLVNGPSSEVSDVSGNLVT